MIMSTHFANNEPYLLLNKNYASCENQTVGNEFGIFWHIIITQFPNLTTNFNRLTFTKKINEIQFAGIPAI